MMNHICSIADGCSFHATWSIHDLRQNIMACQHSCAFCFFQEVFFLGNLPFDNDGDREEKLKALFKKNKVKVEAITGPPTKGFAFVTLANAADKDKVLAMNDTPFCDRMLRINPASERKEDKPAAATGMFGRFGFMLLMKLFFIVTEATGCEFYSILVL